MATDAIVVALEGDKGDAWWRKNANGASVMMVRWADGHEERRHGAIAVKSRAIRQPDGQKIRETIEASEEI